MFLSPRGAHGSSFFNINWNIFISWIRRPSSTIVYGVEVFRYDKLSPKNVFEGTMPTPAAPDHGCDSRVLTEQNYPWDRSPTELRDRPEHSSQPPTLLFSVIFGDVLVGDEHCSSSLSGIFRQIRSQVLISNGFFVSEYGMKNCANIVLEILSCVCSWDKLVAGLAPDRGCRLINWKLCAKLQTNYI